MPVHDPLAAISDRATPQSEPIPDTIPNSAGGYSFAVDEWDHLRRFLVLGTVGGTYYASEKDHTTKNVALVRRLLDKDGVRVVDELLAISLAGRAPKQNQTIFTLALAASHTDPNTRAYALKALTRVCRTGTHLFMFIGYVEQFRGWGPALQRAVGSWYTEKEADALAYQLAKYKQRDGWSHRDVLRLAKPRPARGTPLDSALKWSVGKGLEENAPQILHVTDALAKEGISIEKVVEAIGTANGSLSWEMIPSQFLADKKVWHALLPQMPVTAMVRNLARMTANGLLTGLTNDTAVVVQVLTNPEAIKRSRIHPMALLTAQAQYAEGHGDKGSLKWQPVPAILDALDKAFHLAFVNVEPANKRTLLAIDISGSMTWNTIAGTNVYPREGAAAMALVTLRTEPLTHVTAFSHGGLTPVVLSGAQTVRDVVNTIHAMPAGGTDCSLPMIYATDKMLPVDTFVVYTDSETWAGYMHPVQALKQYRRKMGIPAKLIVVGMVANEFTIADPSDGGMLDVVGFDSAAPALMADFSAGRI